MKYLQLFFLALTGLITAQCSSDKEDNNTYPIPDWKVDTSSFVSRPDWKAEEQEGVDNPDWNASFAGNDEMPNWTPPDMSVYPTSMTCVIRLSPVLEEFADSGDKVAAFIGGECRGIAEPVMVEGVKLYFLMVKAAAEENRDVSFLYYSNSQKRLYKSSETKYEVNKVYGTAADPETPDFERSGLYPYIATAYIALNTPVLPFIPAEGDEIAAFVNDECRSVKHIESENTYVFHLLAKNDAEIIRFKYYSTQSEKIYVSTTNFTINAYGDVIGSISEPVKLDFVTEGVMTAYLKLVSPLGEFTQNDDILAAFCGDKCVGIAEKVSVSEPVYKMQISGTTDGEAIDLKYYSTYGVIVESPAALTFAKGKEEGSQTAPLLVKFDCSGVCPLKMKAYIIPDEDVLRNASSNDILAAFCGDECRGVAQGKMLTDGSIGFQMEIIGSFDEHEQIILKYYCAKTSYMYHSAASFAFDGENSIGSAYDYKKFKFVIE
ncbi:MAG: hypothetical protein ACI31F_05040 [Muribaculaceae bacterium]